MRRWELRDEGEARPEDWTEPGVYEVAPGVHRIPLPLPNDGLRSVNVFALADGEHLTLVDAGWDIPESRRLLVDALGALGAGPGDVERFLVTHVHRDHYTQAVALRRDFATPVALGAGERPAIDAEHDPSRAPLQAQFTQLRSLGAADVADALGAAIASVSPGAPEAADPWEPPDEWLVPGDLDVSPARTLRVVETPGHTRGHVVFRDDRGGLLFAGDHVLPTITPSIGFEPVPGANPLGDFLGSLAAVRAMPDAVLLGAHGPVAPSVHARIDQLLEHHDARLAETESAVASGAHTGRLVAERLRWTRRGRLIDELDLFNRMLAVCETGAHLALLVAQGHVTRVDDAAGVSGYLPA